jgi:hypothetical protein
MKNYTIKNSYEKKKIAEAKRKTNMWTTKQPQQQRQQQ